MVMPLPIPTLIAQGVSAIYSPCKDSVLSVKGKRRDIKALEDRLSKLIKQVMSIKSEREGIDRSLRSSVTREESEAYTVMKTEIAVINRTCIKLIGKYTTLTGNHLSSTTELDVSTAKLMIDKLNDLKSKVWTSKLFKLAKLSREIEKLSTRASSALDILKPEYMIQKKARPNQDKLDYDDDDSVLPVFNIYVDEVLEYLFEEKGNKVGILGCQGAGKTTVLRKLYDRLLQHESLDNVIWIEYPLDTETDGNKIVEMLQNEIMEQLEIHHEASKSIVKNANTISTCLRDKKYILLMDHVSNFIDLENLGLRENHKHKKVVICSREKKVLRRMTEHEVKIQGLKEGEALTLFQNFCCKLNENSKKAIALRIIQCCAGIPWMIRNVAMELKEREDTDSWCHVKRILQSESKSNGFINIGEFDKVYKMKYEGLATDTKKCLLYGALFPHQYKIYADYLIECWIAEGFLAGKTHQKVRLNRVLGQNILNGLTDQDLLRWYSGKKCVMMPPHFRRVALELGYSDDEERCVIWVPSEDQNPDQDTWNRVTRMSLIGCKVELPQSPKCPNIYTLLLRSKVEQLADAFFSQMESLLVLDLNGTEIGALPKSINELVNLKSLYLNGCPRLVTLPPEAANLKKLEFLDICGTSIPTLPQEIRFMVNMRCLRASLSPRRGNRSSKGEQVEEDLELIIPPGIISNLRNLEELSIDAAFDFQGGIAVAERLARELASLEHLNTLCFNFPNVSSLNTFVTRSKALNNIETSWGTHTFRSFKIFIGCHETRGRPYESEYFSGILGEKWLRCSTNEDFSPACQELLKQASAFEIIGHDHGLKSLTCNQFDLHSVKVCVVERCNHLENIVDGYITSENQGIVQGSLLENLEKLYLYDLELLQCIWDGPVPPTSLTNLTAITINGCPMLTNILDPALAHSLHRLEYLKVDDCSRISKIIEGRGKAGEIVEVPEESSNSEQGDFLRRLRKIELSNLPELESICESSSISWNSLKSIVVIRCSKLSNLSLTRTNATKLASIQCQERWWNALTPDEVKQRLLPVCHFMDESIERGEASSNGRSEVMAPHNAFINPPAPSNATDVDYDEGMPLGVNLQAIKTGVQTEEDIQINGNRQIFGREIV